MPISIGHNILASKLTQAREFDACPRDDAPSAINNCSADSSYHLLVSRLLTSSPGCFRHASRTKLCPSANQWWLRLRQDRKIIKQQAQNQPEHAPKRKRRRPTIF